MLQEKKDKLLQIRMSETDYNKLQAIAYVYGTKPTAWVRQMIQMSINAFELSKAMNAEKADNENKETV